MGPGYFEVDILRLKIEGERVGVDLQPGFDL